MRCDPISDLLEERVAAKDFPSATYLVAEKGEIVLQGALGFAVVEPERITANIDTIYDLASLTKVLVTGLLTAKMLETSQLRLDDAVGHYLPVFASELKKDISIHDLATHTSGFEAWVPFYLLRSNARSNTDLGKDDYKDFVATEIAQRPFVDQPKTKVVYSDLNFISLGFLLETLSGLKLDKLFNQEISGKLGLNQTFFRGDLVRKHEIAASENGNGFEKLTCVEKGFLDLNASAGLEKFRKDVIWGEIHDNNAFHMVGVAGHAGLFSTAEEVFKIAQQFLSNYTTLLNPKTCDLFRTNLTPGMNEHRSFAFQLASTPESTAGTKMSPESFGHLGFTGTSLWIDPIKERVFILLTNRTHNRELPFENINSVRRRFHDLAIDHLDKN